MRGVLRLAACRALFPCPALRRARGTCSARSAVPSRSGPSDNSMDTPNQISDAFHFDAIVSGERAPGLT
jgi:hypothetical protein